VYTVALQTIAHERPSSETAVYPHMPILRLHHARFNERRISCAAWGPRAHWTI